MKLLKFIKWKFIDLYRYYQLLKEGKKPFNEYGLRLYSGVQGSGKTMSMVKDLINYREQYSKLLIATNFGYKDEDFALTSLAELPTIAKIARENGYCGVVIGWDEIQNDFDNQTRSFPITILRTITQQRKQGIKILATSQVFTRVAKAIREQTFEVVSCKTVWGRWTFERYYDPIEYEYFIANPDKKNKMICWRKKNFIQTDEIRESYDSYAVIDSLDTRVEEDEKVIQAFFNRSEIPQ
ncbi:ATPase [Enterococcus sp. AZ007]|uniref:ATPase n=1 Tax=Enterococcus sp. AZ007 TaxID=2774839 RepID=UPI003F27553B